ncbi:hypothetical protein EOPP23_04005 [Endozoicomonas sp. OPT23]|uniref:hypothetical protein n=1 Tax=Endozoicomonas sp. OPT23 TaxID=2072845 RepID=UPI00129B548F|nr:hypothetical protein [Endozoicomonas sp. OPT23]MRI32159.1 hypothetical protein [Endozoicomonas sp. OPT23]
MSQVGHTGSTQHTQVQNPNPASLHGAEALDEVARGNLDGENIRYSRESARNGVLQGQLTRAPVLDQPEEVRPTHLESANSDLGEINEANQKALSTTSELAKAMKSGTMTPEQQSQVQKHSDTLRGTASYLNNLHGHNVGSGEGKRSVLAGMGFNQSQLDALTSLANPDDSNNTLASMHGGQAALQGKRDALSSMGFSESQIEAMLSMADPDDESNSLMSTHQAGGGRSSSVAGISQARMDRFMAVLNGQQFGTDAQRALLAKMGYSDTQANMILAGSNPSSLQAQGNLIQSTSTSQVAQLQAMAQAANTLSTGSPVGDRVLQQLVDIFAVLELLHEMSVQGRRTARETRSMEYDAAKQEVLNQAGEMRKAAIYTLAAGVASGTMKIAAGAVSIGGSMSGGSAQQASVRMQQSAQASQMVTGMGDLVAAGLSYQASEHQAKQKEHEAFQKTHENAAQSSSEWMQLQQDMVKTAQSKMDEIIRTWFETLKTTTRG